MQIITSIVSKLMSRFSTPPFSRFDVESEDVEMLAAKEEAIATLPQFWAAIERAREDTHGCLLKFNLIEDEFIWAYNITHRDEKIFGRLANDPFDNRFQAHQEVEINPDDIIDWTYFNGSFAEGHFTTRVIMSRQNPSNAREMASNLGWV